MYIRVVILWLLIVLVRLMKHNSLLHSWNLGVRVMVFSATFNNISVIWRHSVLIVEESRIPGESHWPIVSHWQTLSHNIVLVHLSMSGIQNHNFHGDRHTDCTGSCKSNYHTITLEKNRTLCIKNSYMFRVRVIGFMYVMLLLTIFQLHCDRQFYLCRKPNYTGNGILCERL